MRNETTTEPETVLLAEDDLIPISLIALEIGVSVDWVVGRLGEAVTVDDVGLRAVRAEDARRFFAERDEWKARHDEERAQRAAERIERKPLGGVPAVEGMTAWETMADAGAIVSPTEEFAPHRVGLAQTFMDEQLAEGQRQLAEKRRRTEERDKERLAKKMKKDLS